MFDFTSYLFSYRFASTLALLLEAGVAPQEAFATAGAATGKRSIAEAAASEAEKISAGKSLSAAVAQIAEIAPHLAEWTKVGENAGNLREMLAQAAERCRQSYEDRLNKLLAALEPALILVVGIAVLAVASAVIRPMLALAHAASGA